MFKQIRVAVAAAVVGFSGAACAGGVVAGATEFTQIANMIQLTLSYVEQANSTLTLLRQYEVMLKNLQQMTPSNTLDSAAAALWVNQDMNSTFKSLRQVVVGGQSVSYGMGSLDAAFRRLHPGYGATGGRTYNDQYADWSGNTLGAVRNSMAVVTSHSENFADEQGMVRELQTRSQSASGQLQAIQAASDINVAMVGQLQKLRQLQMAQMQTQNAYMGAEQSQRDNAKAGFYEILRQARPKS